MFTRMLIGLDGSPNADEALEQAVHLGQRFKSRLLVVHVKEPRSMLEERRASDSGALLERAKERVQDAGLPVDVVQKHGDPDIELAALARDVDTVLVGRRGRSSPQSPTAAGRRRSARSSSPRGSRASFTARYT